MSPLLACPICASPITTRTVDDEPTPYPGDYIICQSCLGWLVFSDAGDTSRIRPMTNAEWLHLSTEERTDMTALRENVRLVWQGRIKGEH
jgi:hypothetical protein